MENYKGLIMTDEQLKQYAIERLRHEGTKEGYESVFLEYYVGLKMNDLIEQVKKWQEACNADLLL
jgi:hypothetical protein